MTGLFIKKYHVAVLEEDENFLSRMMDAMKTWYQGRIVIEGFTDSRDMFEAINLSKAKKEPFDMAILSLNEVPEKLVLKQSVPSLNVVMCNDVASLKSEASRCLI